MHRTVRRHGVIMFAACSIAVSVHYCAAGCRQIRQISVRYYAIGCLRGRCDVLYGEPTLDPTNTEIVKERF